VSLLLILVTAGAIYSVSLARRHLLFRIGNVKLQEGLGDLPTVHATVHTFFSKHVEIHNYRHNDPIHPQAMYCTYRVPENKFGQSLLRGRYPSDGVREAGTVPYCENKPRLLFARGMWDDDGHSNPRYQLNMISPIPAQYISLHYLIMRYCPYSTHCLVFPA